MGNEAGARILINKLLEESGWEFGKNFKVETAISDDDGTQFADYVLYDSNNFPLAVLEAKNEHRDPMDGKFQARDYAQRIKARYVILSNSREHYIWDLEDGNPEPISSFPSPETLEQSARYFHETKEIINTEIHPDYIVLSQMPQYASSPDYLDPIRQQQLIFDNKLKFLRPYQLKAVLAIQKSLSEGKKRFLLEMATGTGKTLTTGAIIKLFLKTETTKRVLFLVDRIELEEQAKKDLKLFLANDYTIDTFKQNKAEALSNRIIISTVQSLSNNDTYKKYFSPSDFDLVIADEAHRSISGQARRLFEYFVGFKLGLTATPKNYLKNINVNELSESDPRALEIRKLRDTYSTFGCESGEPSFRYSLLDGVKDGYLISPKVIDARTDITTDLLSKKGYIWNDGSESEEETKKFSRSDYEKKLFSDATNIAFCKTLLEHSLKDPISGEIGKTIVFCVSQKHASKITQILNEMAYELFPNIYNSDFAVKVTSNVEGAQGFTTSFSENNLNGKTKMLTGYNSSRTRICVTVGMMTTGYDCSDILNIALMRPIFSTSEFIQIKGRGTRKHIFTHIQDSDYYKADKAVFNLFDFFANCEYFEKDFDYDEVLKLPPVKESSNILSSIARVVNGSVNTTKIVTLNLPDKVAFYDEKAIGKEGMKIDRMFFNDFSDTLLKDATFRNIYQTNKEHGLDYVINSIFNKPSEYYTLEKLRKAINSDRKVNLREILDNIVFGTPILTKQELLTREVDSMITNLKVPIEKQQITKHFLELYLTYEAFRSMIDNNNIQGLNVYPGFNIQEYKQLGPETKKLILAYMDAKNIQIIE